MKSTGIVRNLDPLGRIVVPKELRTLLGIKSGDGIEIYVEEDKIILKKYNNSCSICGNNVASMVDVGTKQICVECMEKIKNL